MPERSTRDVPFWCFSSVLFTFAHYNLTERRFTVNFRFRASLHCLGAGSLVAFSFDGGFVHNKLGPSSWSWSSFPANWNVTNKTNKQTAPTSASASFIQAAPSHVSAYSKAGGVNWMQRPHGKRKFEDWLVARRPSERYHQAGRQAAGNTAWQHTSAKRKRSNDKQKMIHRRAWINSRTNVREGGDGSIERAQAIFEAGRRSVHIFSWAS